MPPLTSNLNPPKPPSQTVGSVTPSLGYGQAIGAVPGQPVQGPPAPVNPVQPVPGGGAGAPNPYNLPPDLAPNYGDAVYQDIEAAHQRSNAGNMARLNEAKAGYQQLEQDYATREQGLMQNLQGLGQAQRDDLSRQFQQQEAGLTQDMIRRGIYNTSTAMNAERGLRHDQQQQQLRLEDMLTREKMDYARGLSADTLGARGQGGYLGLLERVNETGPDPNMAAQLGQMIGAGQAGTPDYLSALGTGQAQAPSGPQPPGGTLQGPAPGDYDIGSIPANNARSTGLPASQLPPPDFVGGEGGNLGQSQGGVGGTTQPGGMGPGGRTDVGGSRPGSGLGGGSRPSGGSGGGGTTPTPVPTPPTGGAGGAGGAGGSGGGGIPQRTDPGGDGPDVVEYNGQKINVVAQDFYQKHIADRVRSDPNWAWWSDGVIYSMAPLPLQQRMDELRRSAAQAGRFGNDSSGASR